MLFFLLPSFWLICCKSAASAWQAHSTAVHPFIHHAQIYSHVDWPLPAHENDAAQLMTHVQETGEIDAAQKRMLAATLYLQHLTAIAA